MAMINLSNSHATINGGNYTQVNNIQRQTPWDLLQHAAAPSAFHDAGNYFDAPRCHPNTRVAVMNELRDFAFRRGNTGHAKILWLSGAAGAGKSAIARSLCEECFSTSSLLASFFFNRSDPSRNNHKSVVATIAYQVYGSIPPQYQALILGVIERDPLVFTRSVDAQFKALILVPLHDLFENNYFNIIAKRLVVIDGLDECFTSSAQIDILGVIQKISAQTEIPLIFLIASRPENEIQAFFRSPNMLPLLHRLQLNRSYESDADIERFLRDKLQETRDTHTFRDSIPPKWPPDESIRALVRKSSGLFIYASLAVKYITSNSHQPHRRLDFLLNICPPKGDLPFAQLDGLYSHIFSGVEDIDLTLLILGYVISDKRSPSIEEIALINQSELDNCLAALCSLWSVLSIEKKHSSGVRYVHILHKSLPDYLCDAARSGKYYIDITRILSHRAVRCLQYISDVKYTPGSHTARHNMLAFLECHLGQLIDNFSVSHEDLMSFSLIKCYNTFSSPDTRSEEEARLCTDMFWKFSVLLLEWLRNLVSTDFANLYHHYLDEFRELTERHPDVYLRLSPDNLTIDMSIALVTVLIITTQSGSQMPPQIFASPACEPLTSPGPSTRFGRLWHKEIRTLLHDAAMRCLKFLKHDVNHTSVATTLRYLTWVLPYAAQSSELEAACDPRELCLYASTGDHTLFDLAQIVAAATQDCRQKCAEAQQQSFEASVSNHTASDMAPWEFDCWMDFPGEFEYLGYRL